MKRDPRLVPLSHQHHNGLALAVLVSRALDADPSEANVRAQAARIVERFDIEMVNHFAMEEELLFPALGGHPMVVQLIAEHRCMEEMAADLRIAASREKITAFLDLLRAHIRREENELFEYAQANLATGTLDAIGAEIDRRAVRICL